MRKFRDLGEIARKSFVIVLFFALLPVNATADYSENYGRLPLQFELNQNQFDSQVKFLSRGSSYTFFLTATEAVFFCAPENRRTIRTCFE